MEFVDLSRYAPITNPQVLPFRELKKLKPLKLTQDLKVVQDTENLKYLGQLVQDGLELVPIVRVPPATNYLNRNSFPRRILFEMTSKCNFRCRMCPQTNLKRPRINMKGSLYRKVLDEIDEYGIEGIWLYHLGESLLHPEFKENIEHVSTKKNLGVIWMSTNGMLFDQNAIDTVLNSNIDYVNFSMHAVSEAVYDTVAPQGDFYKVRANLENFYQAKQHLGLPSKPFIHCQMIEQETTKHEVDLFLKEHYKRADVVSINMLEYVNLENNGYGEVQRLRDPLSKCLRVQRNDCFICSNGHVTLCDAAYNGELFLGDVNESTLYSIWNGEQRQKILELNEQGRMMDIDFCKTCTDYDI